ncbi:hypothetical protein QTG54_008184 [Skeletonema marinoi]|uniref:Uncharacterized protein n=1 Tax=Skeletonema marinoi TaxID=267567 RepID=A0AAD8Y8J8_9STRA|nr:hypothetical protein QTG54_008184 [Skeletonema marinoi]
MAEDLAREIIAQSGSGSKLAFSFSSGDALLYTSRDANEKIVYHVHQRRFHDDERCYEFKYMDLESAVDLVRALVPYTDFLVQVVLYKDGIDCEEVVFLGKQSSSMLTKYLQDKVKILNAVNVTAM